MRAGTLPFSGLDDRDDRGSRVVGPAVCRVDGPLLTDLGTSRHEKREIPIDSDTRRECPIDAATGRVEIKPDNGETVCVAAVREIEREYKSPPVRLGTLAAHGRMVHARHGDSWLGVHRYEVERQAQERYGDTQRPN